MSEPTDHDRQNVDPPPATMEDGEPRYLEIGPSGQGKRLRGWLTFLAIYLLVAGFLMAFMFAFTRSWLLTTVIVVFMTSYMSVMAWLALRKAERNEE